MSSRMNLKNVKTLKRQITYIADLLLLIQLLSSDESKTQQAIKSLFK
jgi:hypothetical protein